MSTLAESLFAQLQGAPIQQISQQLGIDQAQTTSAIGTALPLLLGALGRNTSQPQGAQSLFGALQKDFSGGNDIAGLLGSVLGGQKNRQTDGAGILGHVFGGQLPRAVAGLGQTTGLGEDKAGQLLKTLAPVVMAFLARQALQGNRQGSSGAGLLGTLLGQEQQQVRQEGGVAAGLLGAVLDQDGDGKLGLGDLMKIGGGLLGGKR